jgi:hypothetical protein
MRADPSRLYAISIKENLGEDIRRFSNRSPGYNGGKTKNSETINLNGAACVRVDGQWVKFRITPKVLTDGIKQEAAQVGDEAVNGEATLYSIHNTTPPTTSILRSGFRRPRRRGRQESQRSRYEYTGVTATAANHSAHK